MLNINYPVVFKDFFNLCLLPPPPGGPEGGSGLPLSIRIRVCGPDPEGVILILFLYSDLSTAGIIKIRYICAAITQARSAQFKFQEIQ